MHIAQNVCYEQRDSFVEIAVFLASAGLRSQLDRWIGILTLNSSVSIADNLVIRACPFCWIARHSVDLDIGEVRIEFDHRLRQIVPTFGP